MAVSIAVKVGRSAAKAYRLLLKGGLVLQRNLRRRLGISNRKGWEPSAPGESPRRSQFGWLQRSVRVQGNGVDEVKVGVGEEAKYGLYLEYGAKPRTIIPRKGEFLMIPILRNLDEEEAKEMGAKKVLLRRTGRKEWVIWRKSVKHPGIKPRPWLRPGLLDSMPALRVIFRIPGS